ncbi:MAG: DUF6498-containing protein [Planctomycetota bacterium]
MGDRDDNKLEQGQSKGLLNRRVLQLLVSNVIIIVWAVYEKWDAELLIWIYWAQSIIIGVFWFLRILTHDHLYSPDKLGIDKRPQQIGLLARTGFGFFFMFHYGAFHLVYLLCLLGGVFSSSEKANFFFPARELFFAGIIFVASEYLSFRKDPNQSRERAVDIGILIGYPYKRIFPMHITIIISGLLQEHGFSSQWILYIFLVLKTIADINGQLSLERGFASKRLKKAFDKNVFMEKNLYGDKLVLKSGLSVDLDKHPELSKRIEAIFDLPEGVQDEVVRRLLAKEEAGLYEQVEVQCQCEQVDTFSGESALNYAQYHLRLLYKVGDGSKLFVCPQTSRQWIQVADTLKQKEKQEV